MGAHPWSCQPHPFTLQYNPGETKLGLKTPQHFNLSSLHSFISVLDDIRGLKEHLLKCQQAAKLVEAMDEGLYINKVHKGDPPRDYPLLKLEATLLSLQPVCEGIVYFLPVLVDVKRDQYVVRYYKINSYLDSACIVIEIGLLKN